MTDRASHLVRGERAEALAARYLTDQGLVPVAANVRCRWGELDLVMLDEGCLVVVEVRCRQSTAIATPLATIGPAKCRRIIQATRVFLRRQPAFALLPVRFDVVGISGADDAPRIDWCRRAFTADDVAAGRG